MRLNSKILNVLYLSFLIFTTVALLVWQRYGMDRSLFVYGNDAQPINTYPVNDQASGGNSSAFLDIVDDRLFLSCELDKNSYQYAFCQVAFEFPEAEEGVDLSVYDQIELKLGYVDSPNSNIRVQIKNTSPLYSIEGDQASLKFNLVEYNPEIEGTELSIELDHFKVPEWWTTAYKIPIFLSEPEFDHIKTIEISTGTNMDGGEHVIWVEEITFTGKWLSYTEVLSIIISVWLGSALILLLITVIRLQKGFRKNRKLVKELGEINAALNLHSKEMERQAKTDPLTGSWNRAGVNESLLEWQTLVRQDRMDFSIIFCDIDHFKKVNDTHGHSVGDLVIIEIASLLRSQTRNQDLVVRWGGEEFVLLCPHSNLDAATTLAYKLKSTFANQSWPESLNITCSFGVSQMKPTENIEQLLKRADKALYEAKDEGRNRVKTG